RGGGSPRGLPTRDRPTVSRQPLVRLPPAPAPAPRRDPGSQAARGWPTLGTGARRPATPRRTHRRPTRRRPGAAAAAGRVLVQPDDPVAGPAPPPSHPQEADAARRRAGPARRPDEATLVPQEGQADRARTACFRG